MRATAARCAAETRVIPSTYELGAASRVASGSATIETVDERDVAMHGATSRAAAIALAAASLATSLTG